MPEDCGLFRRLQYQYFPYDLLLFVLYTQERSGFFSTQNPYVIWKKSNVFYSRNLSNYYSKFLKTKKIYRNQRGKSQSLRTKIRNSSFKEYFRKWWHPTSKLGQTFKTVGMLWTNLFHVLSKSTLIFLTNFKKIQVISTYHPPSQQYDEGFQRILKQRG